MAAPDKKSRQAQFWKKFLRLTRGRVSVLRALEVIAEEERNASFHRSILSIHDELQGGSSLSEAMGKQSDLFSLSIMELIKTAEKTGAWDEVLQEIIEGLTDGTFDAG